MTCFRCMRPVFTPRYAGSAGTLCPDCFENWLEEERQRLAREDEDEDEDEGDT